MTESIFFTLAENKYLARKTSGLRQTTKAETECANIYVKMGRNSKKTPILHVGCMSSIRYSNTSL